MKGYLIFKFQTLNIHYYHLNNYYTIYIFNIIYYNIYIYTYIIFISRIYYLLFLIYLFFIFYHVITIIVIIMRRRSQTNDALAFDAGDVREVRNNNKTIFSCSLKKKIC